METYSKTGLALVFVNVVILIAIVVMYPVHSIIGLIAILYLVYKGYIKVKPYELVVPHTASSFCIYK